MNIFVGNLSFDAVEADVKKLFEGFGNVVSVVIVMSKEKKAPKSRGFGFVEMAEDQQALDAIAALHGKEFMGRALNVEQARAKVEIQEPGEPKDKAQPEVEVQEDPKEEKKAPVRPAFIKKPGVYKSGRRTQSYIKRTGKPVEEKPRWANRDNPMRWRKRSDQPRPWQKAEEGGRKPPWQKASSERKPWQKTEGSSRSRPWKKSEAGQRPWKKAEGSRKPWQKATGERKPWQKSEEGGRSGSARKPSFSSRGKPGGGYKRK